MPEQPREQILDGALIPYHVHATPYFAVVLEGSYVETSSSGRFEAIAGDILYHPPFQHHFDLISARGARVINLPAAPDSAGEGWWGRLSDPGKLIRLAARGIAEAVEYALALAERQARLVKGWPDLLAQDLAEGEVDGLADWAAARGLRPEAVSRGFRRSYGMSPVRFAADLRARRAWNAVVATTRPLTEIAHAHGFADQAHMTREIVMLTKRSPGAWRASYPRPG